MDTTPQFFLIPLVELSVEVELAVNRWYCALGLSELHIDPDTALTLTIYLVEDMVDDRLQWADAGCRADAMLTELIARTPVVMEVDDFRARVLDDVVLTLHDIIDVSIPYNTWRTYTVRHMHRSLMIEAGEDYRILDWHRIQAEAQCTPTDASISATVTSCPHFKALLRQALVDYQMSLTTTDSL